jgi:uncharacterized protein YjiS (DUF1127 family)
MEVAMTTQVLSRLFALPRFPARRILDWFVAADRLHRERHDLAALDERALRDIGMTRADVDHALSHPGEHLRLILMGRGKQF